MNINLVYNPAMKGYIDALNKAQSVLSAKGVQYKAFDLNSMQKYGDFTLAMGGDGTILKAARFYSDESVPVLGINLGRLGFLSQASSDEIENVITAVLEKKYYIEERTMLKSGDFLALNDFVIKGCDPSRTSKFFLEINDKCVCAYIADGLIISTPTGSTAYGLSAGGPVLYPTLDSVIIVPICPHTLNARPLVIPANENITVRTADKNLTVSIDGYESFKCVDNVSINVAANKARLAFLEGVGFYNVLSKKLHWGVSPKA